jgi:amidase
MRVGMNSIVFESVKSLSEKLVTKEISSVELLDASFAQIDRFNPTLNAIITFDRDGAYANARAVDARRMRGDPTSPLAGLPIAIKDMEPTKGLRTTQGSPILKDWIPDYDTMMVERFRAHGLTIIGKTNTPEFALGSLFGATKNPWDLTKTCGGSSGGAAVAAATGMIAFADGSDMGGSLRNPANFCGVVGLRPSPGRVPVYPALNHWSTLSVHGPIARTAEDAAWLLSIQAGDDPRVTLGCCGDPGVYRESLVRDFTDVRIAYSPTLGGLPVEKQVREALDASIKHFEALGAIVEEAEPDLLIADNAFQVLRALHLLGSLLPHYKKNKHLMKDTAVWNVEQGLKLTAEQISEAQLQQSMCFERMRRFLTKYEYLICPVNQVAPFDINKPYPMEIDGTKLDTYLDWMKSAFRITMTSHPAASAHVGFTSSGLTNQGTASLPVGMQIVGRYGCEREVLQLVHAVETPLDERVAPAVRESASSAS